MTTFLTGHLLIRSHLNFSDGQVRPSEHSRASASALERRLAHQRNVISMGLTPDMLSKIVDEFYIRVRNHAILGPVFEDRIGDDWGPHLIKMKLFWESVALNSGTYSGKPVVTHKALTNVTNIHFSIWLGLFRQTVRDITGSKEATEFLNGRALKMATNFKKAMGIEIAS